MNLGEPLQKNDADYNARLAYHIDVIIVTWAAFSVIVVLGSVILSCICCYSKGNRRQSSSFYSYSDSQRDTVHLEDLLSKPSLADPESVFSEISIDGCLSVRTSSWIGTSEANSSPVLVASASAQCIDSMALQSTECHNTATASAESVSKNSQGLKGKWKSHSQKNLTTKNKAHHVSRKKKYSRSQSVTGMHGPRGKSSHDMTRSKRGADTALRTQKKLTCTVNPPMPVQNAFLLMKEELTGEKAERTFNKQSLLPNETKSCDNTDGSEAGIETPGGEEYTGPQEKEMQSKSVTNKNNVTTELKNTENVKPTTRKGNHSIGQHDIVCHFSTEQTDENACVTIESQAKINHVTLGAGNLDNSKNTGEHQLHAQSSNVDATPLNARYRMSPPQMTTTSVETRIGSATESSQGRENSIPLRRSFSQVSESTNAIQIHPKMKTLSLNLQIDFHFENDADSGVKPPVSVIRCASASGPTPEEEDTDTARPLSHSPCSPELPSSTLWNDPNTTVKDTLQHGPTCESTGLWKSRIRSSESTISKTDTAFSKEAKRRYSLDESYIGLYKEISDNLQSHDFMTSNLNRALPTIDKPENKLTHSGNKRKTKLPTAICDPITADIGSSTSTRGEYNAVALAPRMDKRKKPASTDVSFLGTHSELDDKSTEVQNVNPKGDIIEETCEGITKSHTIRVGVTQELAEPSDIEESRDITKSPPEDNVCFHNLNEERDAFVSTSHANASRAVKSNTVSNSRITPTERITRMRSASAEYSDHAKSVEGTKTLMTFTSDPNLPFEKNTDCRSESSAHNQRSGIEGRKYVKAQSAIDPVLSFKKLPPKHLLEVEENVLNYSKEQKCEENTVTPLDKKKKTKMSPEYEGSLGSEPILKKGDRFDSKHSRTPINQCSEDFGSDCCQNNEMTIQEARIDYKQSRTDGESDSCLTVPQEQNHSKDFREIIGCPQIDEETSAVKLQTEESTEKHINRKEASRRPLRFYSATNEDGQDGAISDGKVMVDLSDKNKVQPKGHALQKQNQMQESGIGLAQNLSGTAETASNSDSRIDLQVKKELYVPDSETAQEADDERGEDEKTNAVPDVIVSDESDYDNPWDDLDSAVKRASIRYNRRPSRIAAGDTKTLMLKSAEDLGRLLEEAEKRRHNRRIEARSSCKITSPSNDESNLTIPFTRFSPHRHTVKGIMPQPAVEAAPIYHSTPPITKRSKTPSPKLSLFRSRQDKKATVGIDPDRPKSLSSKVRSKISSPETKIRKT